jgi:hypothetical protein
MWIRIQLPKMKADSGGFGSATLVLRFRAFFQMQISFGNLLFGTVKAGNIVTFFAQINFFLKNALR